MDDVVLMEVRETVAVLTLNRPDRLNAWTPELQTRYFDLLDECAADPTCEPSSSPAPAAGSAPARTCGACRHSPATADPAAATARSPLSADQRPVRYPLSIPKPIIAAINGPCAGIGLVLALMCDLRFTTPQAKFTTAFARRGLVGEHGISWLLPRLVGPAHALDLLLSARVVLGTEAARSDWSIAPWKETCWTGRCSTPKSSLANVRPPAWPRSSSRVYADLEASLPESVEEANRLMGESFAAGDFAEGVQSFLERRSPRFAPLGS